MPTTDGNVPRHDRLVSHINPSTLELHGNSREFKDAESALCASTPLNACCFSQGTCISEISRCSSRGLYTKESIALTVKLS